MVQSNPATSIDLSGKTTLIRAAHHGGHTAAWALYSTDFNHEALTSEGVRDGVVSEKQCRVTESGF